MNLSSLDVRRLFLWIENSFGADVWNNLIAAAATFVVVLGILWMVRKYALVHLERWSKQTAIKIDDLIISVFKGIHRISLVIVSMAIASKHLSLPSMFVAVIDAVLLITIVYEVIKVAERIILYVIHSTMKNGEEEHAGISTAFTVMIRIILWAIGFLLVLSNLGFDVTSLIAGLGIGGLAVSLALQNVFQDIFSSFAILIDKPFVEGDFIVLGDQMGTVKQIGLKTTRLETLQGEELVVSNTELTSTRIQNFKKLQKRRAVFSVGATYDTSVAKLKKVPDIIRQIVSRIDKAELDRVHFKEMGDFSLNFEIVYYIDSAEYAHYMDIQEEMNLRILEAFSIEGIDIAFPTQTVYVEKSGE